MTFSKKLGKPEITQMGKEMEEYDAHLEKSKDFKGAVAYQLCAFI